MGFYLPIVATTRLIMSLITARLRLRVITTLFMRFMRFIPSFIWRWFRLFSSALLTPARLSIRRQTTTIRQNPPLITLLPFLFTVNHV